MVSMWKGCRTYASASEVRFQCLRHYPYVGRIDVASPHARSPTNRTTDQTPTSASPPYMSLKRSAATTVCIGDLRENPVVVWNASTAFKYQLHPRSELMTAADMSTFDNYPARPSGHWANHCQYLPHHLHYRYPSAWAASLGATTIQLLIPWPAARQRSETYIPVANARRLTHLSSLALLEPRAHSVQTTKLRRRTQ